MNPNVISSILKKMPTPGEWLTLLAVFGMLILQIAPIPSGLLDRLLILNLATCICMLLASLYPAHPLLGFQYPTLILLASLFRLSLNIASMRLILNYGNTGTLAAGKIIESFGKMMMFNHFMLSFTIFILLSTINFSVILFLCNKISKASSARSLFNNVNQETTSEFFSLMMGANKFIREGVIVDTLMILVGILGGIAIGVQLRHLDFNRAVSLYALMVMGSAILAQVAALLTATTSAVMVNRQYTH